jgi:hypothetical protein
MEYCAAKKAFYLSTSPIVQLFFSLSEKEWEDVGKVHTPTSSWPKLREQAEHVLYFGVWDHTSKNGLEGFLSEC